MGPIARLKVKLLLLMNIRSYLLKILILALQMDQGRFNGNLALLDNKNS